MNQSLHREIFNEILLVFKYSAKQVCAFSGMGESRLSRFRTGKLDLEAGEFFNLVESLPEEARNYFWAKKLGKLPSIQEQVKALDFDNVADILESISSKLKSSSKLSEIAQEKCNQIFI